MFTLGSSSQLGGLLGGAAALVIMAALPGQGRADQFRTPAPATAAPAGSFERAGIALFVRAHEARRQAARIAPVSPRPVPVAALPAASLVFSEPDAAVQLELDLADPAGGPGKGRWLTFGDQPTRPGSLAREAVDSPFGKSGLINPHAKPDLELELSRRATLGLFGEAGRIEPTDIRNHAVKPLRELGAGVTLQYRFGN
jgi:hypothetical protein